MIAACALQADLQLQLEGPSWKINPKDAFIYDGKVDIHPKLAVSSSQVCSPWRPQMLLVPSVAHLEGQCCLCVGCDPLIAGWAEVQLMLLALQAPLGNMSQAVAALQHQLQVTKLGRDELERWVHQRSIILQIRQQHIPRPGAHEGAWQHAGAGDAQAQSMQCCSRICLLRATAHGVSTVHHIAPHAGLKCAHAPA